MQYATYGRLVPRLLYCKLVLSCTDCTFTCGRRPHPRCSLALAVVAAHVAAYRVKVVHFDWTVKKCCGWYAEPGAS